MNVQISQVASLRQLHTMGLEVSADELVSVRTEDEVREVVKWNRSPQLVLGGGSNMLFTRDYAGLIIRVAIPGIDIVKRYDQKVLVAVGAGVVWHDFVNWCLDHDFGGVENLALIPGTVGAAPIQNIGAYGVEFEAVFKQVEAIDLQTGEKRVFDKAACEFGYRWSVFKGALKSKYLLTRVWIELTTQAHQLHLHYGAISHELGKLGILNPSIREVGDTVCAIRRSKLPDPAQVGNAGSFFKNPILDRSRYEALQQDYPDMPCYEVDQQWVKVPAAWLIEHCGWKGHRSGDAGVYERHALVLVNYGHATGAEMYDLARAIQASVQEVFDIDLEPEVNIIS